MATATARPENAEWDGETTAGDGSEPRDDSTAAVEVERGGDDVSIESLSVPDDATDEEVAAIAAAIQAHLREEERAAQETEDRTGDRWNLSTRMLQVGRTTAHIPPDVPADSWVAASRIG